MCTWGEKQKTTDGVGQLFCGSVGVRHVPAACDEQVEFRALSCVLCADGHAHFHVITAVQRKMRRLYFPSGHRTSDSFTRAHTSNAGEVSVGPVASTLLGNLIHVQL